MMSQAAVLAEIYLLPGDFHFGDGHTRIQTILGSCVSIALWHPILRSGGMCHFVLPSRGKPGKLRLDGRYADEAVKMIQREIGKNHTLPGEYQVKLVGGGNMFQPFRGGGTLDVARGNVEAARVLLEAHGFNIQAEDVGGHGHRRVIFDLCDGSMWVRHEKIPAAWMADGKPVAVKRSAYKKL
jgi:chemotaxis protein CheD